VNAVIDWVENGTAHVTLNGVVRDAYKGKGDPRAARTSFAARRI